MKAESRIVKKIRTCLVEEFGATTHKYFGGPFSEIGHADLYGTLAKAGGRAYFFEVKRPGEVATVPQLNFLKREAAAGAITGVVTSVEDVRRILSTCSI